MYYVLLYLNLFNYSILHMYKTQSIQINCIENEIYIF